MSSESIRQANETFLLRLGAFLRSCPQLDPQNVQELASEFQLPIEEACLLMLAAQMELDADLPEDRYLIRNYLEPGFRILKPEPYLQDLYRQNVVFPFAMGGRWTLADASFGPFEVFVRDDLRIMADGRQIPQIGAFEEAFSFPVVFESGVEWMSLAPVEIESMREPIRQARGRVMMLGLGLGYYAYHVSKKPEVSALTIVERDPELIQMFQKELLPQFPGADKIQIAEADAFEYVEQVLRNDRYDEVFCDLWRDAGDGVQAYQRLKALERKTEMHFSYWIENLIRQQIELMDGSQQ